MINIANRSATSRIPTATPKGSSYLGSSRIAHSQPGSRSTSPTPKYSYLTHTNGGLTSPLINNLNTSNNMNNDLVSTPNGFSNNGTLKLNGYSGGLRSANSSATKSKIPTSSRNSSRESSPGRRSSINWIVWAN
jgi:hypothetical protein